MSTPSEKGSDSTTTPPPPMQSEEGQDTASSMLAMGVSPGVTMQWFTNTPNAAFTQRMRNIRSRSVPPWPRRVVSPSLSVAQSRARTAELKADTALSSAERIADQTIRAQSVANDAIAEARAVHGEVESRISELMQRAEINTSSILGEVTGEVKRVVEQTQAQTSHAVGSAVQQLEKEIEVAVSSATAMSECATQMAVAEVRRDFQAQLEQTRAELQRRDADAKWQMDEIAASLTTLTNQLNRFKLASVADVSGSQEQLSSAVEEKLSLQSVRLDAVSEMVTDSQQAAQETADLLTTCWWIWKIWEIMLNSYGKR